MGPRLVVRAVTAWAASDPPPRAWWCGSSGWSPSSVRRCGLGRDHDPRRDDRQCSAIREGQEERRPMTNDSGHPTDAELNAMSREELVELGGKLDGVEIVFKEPRWPVPGTKAEKRAERLVAIWLLLGGLLGLALLLVFLFWPWEYQPNGSDRKSVVE